MPVPAGTHDRPGVEQHEFVMTDKHQALLADMIRSHATSDMCIIGGRGVGKSAVVTKVWLVEVCKQIELFYHLRCGW